jgi:hypothetical protein
VNSAALLDRMNFGLALTTNKIQGTTFTLAQLMTAPATLPVPESDPYQAQLQLEQALLAGNISQQTHETIEQRIVAPETIAEGQPGNHPPNVNVIAGLLLGSPEFQRK